VGAGNGLGEHHMEDGVAGGEYVVEEEMEDGGEGGKENEDACEE